MYEKFNKEIEPNVFTIEDDIDKNADWFEVHCPHTRIRGKNVTPEQAIEILAKTEQFFMWHDYHGRWNHNEPVFKRLNVEYFCNQFFTRGVGIGNYGFMHPDGVIGLNTILDRYAEPEVLIDEAKELASAFPYLDMIMAVSTWGCYPPEYWDGTYEVTPGVDRDGSYMDKNLWDNADFNSAIEFCVHIKKGKIYFAFDKIAQEMYRNYEPVDEDRFFAEYNVTNEIVEYGTDAFKKCFSILGVNYEEHRKKYRDADHVQDEYNIESHAIPMSILLNPACEE